MSLIALPKRLRRVSLLLYAIIISSDQFLSAALADPPPRYRLVEIVPSFVHSNYDAIPNSISDSGSIAGVLRKFDVMGVFFQGFVWSNDVTSTPFGLGTMFGINDIGDAVGGSRSMTVRYDLSSGISTTAAHQSTFSSFYTGINNARFMVGSFQLLLSETEFGINESFIAGPAGTPGELTDLVLTQFLPTATASIPAAMNELNDVLIHRDTNGDRLLDSYAIWRPSDPSDPVIYPTETSVYAINDHAQAVGFVGDATNAPAMLFNYETGASNAIPGLERAQDINNRGEIIGYLSSAGGRPQLWRDGVAYDLNSLLAPGSTKTINSVAEINNRGWIMGTSWSSAFVAIPDPEPGRIVNANFNTGNLIGWNKGGDIDPTTYALLGSVQSRDLGDGNAVAELTAGSNVYLSQYVDIPGTPDFLNFDYQFVTGEGTLTFSVDRMPIPGASFNAADSAVGQFRTASLNLAQLGLLNRVDALLQFDFTGPNGSQVLIDNVRIGAAVPEPSTLLLTVIAAALACVFRKR